MGCAGPAPRPEPPREADPLATTPEPYRSEALAIMADPVAYLRRVHDRAEALEHYRLTFYRQERFGNRLREAEKIDALFRKHPFSVKFTWPEPDDYYESVYVAGENDDKLIVRERKGALPLLPPTVRRINPQDAVVLGRARNAITDFGLARVARRTLLPFEPATGDPRATARYLGFVELEPQKCPAYHLRIERPPGRDVQYTRNDFYIDARTLLPAGVDLYLPSGDLDARYRYADVDSSVRLTDADFRIAEGRKPSKVK
ncbi:MAG: hypothetical protein AMXMBFR83_10270 [Phycisphaerae bacterium]